MQELSLRPIADTDRDFLCRLYASTRQQELEPVPWSEAVKQSFLEGQFAAQHAYYGQQFPDAAFDLVLLDGEPIGRLYLDRRPEEHRVIDIALLPEHRGRGIGRRLMEEVLAAASAEGKVVRIHVERNNPALRLYRRLGFSRVEDQGVYLLLEWTPDAAVGAAGRMEAEA